LNGAILGMSRAEVRKKFDEIVAFAEVDKFLDTPVKRYSSGMYVRLAFAVAAHLEPEILIVDEVLAVGDAEFQKKCLGKMDEVSRRQGRTVLFVSHNMSAIAQLANRVVLLDGGSVSFDGPAREAIAAYLAKRTRRELYIGPHDEDYASPHVARAEVVTSGSDGLQHFGEPLDIKVWVRHPQCLPGGHLGVQIIDQSQIPVTTVYAYPPDCVFGTKPGTTLIEFHVPSVRLNIGRFYLRIWVTGPPGAQVCEIVEACDFEVVRHDFLSWWTPQHCAYHEEFSLKVVSYNGARTTADRIAEMETLPES
ncbi:MAG TPA: hypothetical protein VMF86_13335, partial [Stellaceae bacterium]|nr:hypothetical protein [Stellaceae bacterium]